MRTQSLLGGNFSDKSSPGDSDSAFRSKPSPHAACPSWVLLFPPVPLCHGSSSEQNFLPCHLQFSQMISTDDGAVKKKKKRKEKKQTQSLKPTNPNTEPTQTVRRKQVFLTMDSCRHEGHLWQGRHKCPAQF